MRVVLCGSPPFATSVLSTLLGSSHAVLVLVTLPDRPQGRGQKLALSPLVELAASHSVRVMQSANPHAPEVLAELAALVPDVLCVASYGVILKPALLELAPHGALNVHASLLPRHRGAAPIQAAILAGDRETGVSVQRMVLALDEGDVLVERATAIGPEENAGELGARLAALGGEALVEALDRIERGQARYTPQDPVQATYARKIRKEAGWIDWSKPASELARSVRAYNPWPLARAIDPKGRELALLCARERTELAGEPGAVLESERALVVACGAGALEILDVLPAGKQALSAAAFLRGARLERGARFAPAPRTSDERAR